MNQLSCHPPHNPKRPRSLEEQRRFIQTIIERGTAEQFQILSQAKADPGLHPEVKEFIKIQLMLADLRGINPSIEGDGRRKKEGNSKRIPRHRGKKAKSTFSEKASMQ